MTDGPHPGTTLHAADLFRAIFERSLLATFVFDDDLRCVDANEAASRLLGYEHGDLVGMHADDIRVAPSDPRVLRGTREGETQLRRRDGSVCDVFFSATAEVRPGLHVVAVRDLTEQKRLEDQLRQAQKMEAVGRLAGGIAHDFNNLLTAIGGYSEFLVAALEDERLRRQAAEIKKASDRAAMLTAQLLAYSRRQVLQPRVLDVRAVVSDMQMMLRRLIGEHVELVTILDPATGAVRADPSQLEQVIVNLVVNARDAMPDGGVLTIETGDFDHSERGRCVVLAITDTGVGISPETRAQLFEPFFTTKDGSGTGLGLSTVYGIVEQSGGWIDVDSAVGAGSSFRIYLPRADEPAERIGEDAPDVQGSAAPGTETILLVEDETIVRELVTEILESVGYAVLAAADGNSALEIVRAHAGHIDLLLTDVVMPGMSGREVAQAVSALRPGTRVLYMSGYTDSAIVQHGVLEEGTSFLQKPFSAADLTAKVRSLIEASAP